MPHSLCTENQKGAFISGAFFGKRNMATSPPLSRPGPWKVAHRPLMSILRSGGLWEGWKTIREFTKMDQIVAELHFVSWVFYPPAVCVCDTIYQSPPHWPGRHPERGQSYAQTVPNAIRGICRALATYPKFNVRCNS